MYRRTKILYFSPTFKEYTGLSPNIGYGCGKCEGTTLADGKCKECAADGCNKVEETGANFNCHNYTVTEDEEKVVTITKKEAATVCKRLKDTEAKCNM